MLPNCLPYPIMQAYIRTLGLGRSVIMLVCCWFSYPYTLRISILLSPRSKSERIKRHYQQIEDYDDFTEFLAHTVSEVCCRDARGHFRECGYVLEKRR